MRWKDVGPADRVQVVVGAVAMVIGIPLSGIDAPEASWIGGILAAVGAFSLGVILLGAPGFATLAGSDRRSSRGESIRHSVRTVPAWSILGLIAGTIAVAVLLLVPAARNWLGLWRSVAAGTFCACIWYLLLTTRRESATSPASNS